MYFDKALVAESSAQEVANTVAAFLRGEHEGKFFKLVVAKPDGTDREELWLTTTSRAQPIATSPKTEWVKCQTDDGREIDLFIPVDRTIGVALVLMSKAPTQTHP